jgi:hypothetical protein
VGKLFLAVLNWASGGVLDKVLGFVERRETEKLAAMNSEQQRAHEDRMAARQAAKDIRLATAGYWEMRLLTFLIALPFLVHLWLVAWDTYWPQPWTVEKLPAPFDEWEGAILLSFFGVSVVGSGIKAVAGAIAYRR